MDTKNYKLMTTIEARKALNELGYPVEGSDDPVQVFMGMIVVLAEEIEKLKKQNSPKEEQDENN